MQLRRLALAAIAPGGGKAEILVVAQGLAFGRLVLLAEVTAAGFLARDGSLDGVAPHVADSGEGRWTVAEAIEQGVPAPVLALALMSRFDSQGKGDYANRMLAMMRQAFGGHAVHGAGTGKRG